MLRINFSQRLIIINSAILTLLIVFLSIFIIPKTDKYKTKILKEINFLNPTVIAYFDLNNDGNTEKISFFKNYGGTLSVLAEDQGKVLFQNKYDGKFLPNRFYFFDDYDNDGKNEIYLFRCLSDTLVLDIINVYPELYILQNFQITKVHPINGVIDFYITGHAFEDIDRDGYKEFIFSMDCGYSYKNRYIFILNIRNKHLQATPKSGTTITELFTLCDIDSDGHKEIFGKYNTCGNTKPDYPWTDQLCWLMVYNDSLKFKFDPYATGQYPGELTTQPYYTGKRYLISEFQNDYSATDSTFIGLYNPEGKLIRYKKYQYSESFRHSYLYTYPKNKFNRLALLTDEGKVQEFDSSLNVVITKQIPNDLYPIYPDIDIDADGQYERFYMDDSNNKIFIIREDFTFPTLIDFDVPIKEPIFSIKKQNGKSPVISLSTVDKYYEIEYKHNFFYEYRYVIYLLLSALVFFFFYAIGQLYATQLKRRFDSEKNIANLQLKALEGNQLNPHFSLNIINSIGALYEKSDIPNAQYYFGKYTKLLRQSLMWSGQISNSLTNEIDFVKSYLELEKLRLNGDFEFFIDDSNIPEIQIPKFLLHTFTENAIKHAIIPIVGIRKGIISIQTISNATTCKILISDNGVGIQNSTETSEKSTGKGFIILNEMLSLYRKVTGKNVKYKIGNNRADRTGTTVTILVDF